MTLLFSTALLALAWFAAINAAVSVAAWGIATVWAIDGTGRARTRGRWLLLVRLTPFLSAALVAGVLFLPAHVLLEPRETDETFGAALYALAFVALALIARAALRALAVVRADRQLGRWTRSAARLRSAGASGAWEVPGLRGISLAGIVRPRVLIGRAARLALTPAELEIAVAHERAHQRAGDNLKRVLMYCVPDLFGATEAARRLEAAWRGEAEHAADGVAAGGDPDRAATLASALVKIARLGGERSERPCSPAWSAFHEPALLESRVRRLVSAAPPAAGRRAALWPFALAAAAPLAAWLSGVPVRLHQLTELLIQMLP